ncbi:MAG: hypothetical protein LBM23_07300 [Propionibacteriaceae bacterium]|jgi:hypothetical protein|nr:hypothetical protein [Propionibacteriaceae bacterium]
MTLVERAVAQYRRWRYRERPIPAVVLEAPSLIPALVPRVVAALLLGVLVLVPALWVGLAPIPLAIAVLGVVAAAMGMPGAIVAAVATGIAAFFLAIGPAPTIGPAILALVCCVHVGWRLAVVAGLTGWRGWIQAHALLSWRDVVVLLIAAVLWLISLVPVPAPVPLAIVGAVALVVAVLRAAPGGRRRS